MHVSAFDTCKCRPVSSKLQNYFTLNQRQVARTVCSPYWFKRKMEILVLPQSRYYSDKLLFSSILIINWSLLALFRRFHFFFFGLPDHLTCCKLIAMQEKNDIGFFIFFFDHLA